MSYNLFPLLKKHPPGSTHENKDVLLTGEKRPHVCKALHLVGLAGFIKPVKPTFLVEEDVSLMMP